MILRKILSAMVVVLFVIIFGLLLFRRHANEDLQRVTGERNIMRDSLTAAVDSTDSMDRQRERPREREHRRLWPRSLLWKNMQEKENSD